MVFLTITDTLVEAINKANSLPSPSNKEDEVAQNNNSDETERVEQDASSAANSKSPFPNEPIIGNPISHGQIVDLWKALKHLDASNYSLENLLHKSRVYIAPASPKPEPNDGYKALMARLRREEEARAYQRMINPPPPIETFSSRFPSASMYFAANAPHSSLDLGDDDVTYTEIHRQVTLIINFVVSIAGVAGTLWIVSRWWSVPARLFLVLGGSILVAVAEVAVYSAYVWRMDAGKKKESSGREVREIVKTWVVGEDDQGAQGDADGHKDLIISEEKGKYDDNGVRKRHTAHKHQRIV